MSRLPRFFLPLALLAFLVMGAPAYAQQPIALCEDGATEAELKITQRDSSGIWDVLGCGFKPGEQVTVEASIAFIGGEIILDSQVAEADASGSFLVTFEYSGDAGNLDNGYTFNVVATGGQGTIATGQVAVIEDEEPPVTDTQQEGGIIATFEVAGERFRVWVTNPQTIQQIRDLEAGRSTANIPNGRIHRGAGASNHNAPWSWHLDPVDISMADATIELCDARPSYVEENVDYFVDTVKRYCPWGAELISVEESATGGDNQQEDVQDDQQKDTGAGDDQQGGNQQEMVTKTFELTLYGNVPANDYFTITYSARNPATGEHLFDDVGQFCSHAEEAEPCAGGAGTTYVIPAEIPRGAELSFVFMRSSTTGGQDQEFHSGTETITADMTNSAWFRYSGTGTGDTQDDGQTEGDKDDTGAGDVQDDQQIGAGDDQQDDVQDDQQIPTGMPKTGAGGMTDGVPLGALAAAATSLAAGGYGLRRYVR